MSPAYWSIRRQIRNSGSPSSVSSAVEEVISPKVMPRAFMPVTAPTTWVLARDQLTGAPVTTYTAHAGEFRNQPYVNAVLSRAAGYGYMGGGLSLAGASGPIGALLVLGMLAALFMRWRAGR